MADVQGNAAGDADVFARLVQHTTDVLQQPVIGDTWLQLTDKILKRKRIEKPLSITSFASSILLTPAFYLLLLENEKMVAVQNIQGALRSQFSSQPYLVDEACSLVFLMSNVLILGTGKPPLTVYEAVEPLISVLEGKITYLKGKRQGVTPAAIASVVAQQNAVAPVDKELDKKGRMSDRIVEYTDSQKSGRKRYR